MNPLKAAVPMFVFAQMMAQMLAAFLRNDNDFALVTFAVVFTPFLNIIGDYLFTITFNGGVYGAALATALSNILSVCRKT